MNELKITYLKEVNVGQQFLYDCYFI